MRWPAEFLFIIAVVSHHTYCSETQIIIASNCEPNNTQCTTFSKCFTNPETCFMSNTTVMFIPDTYRINKTTAFIIRDIQNVQLKTTSESKSTLPPVSIVCLAAASFAFVNVSNLTISDIAFLQCGATLSSEVNSTIGQQIHLFFIPSSTLKAALFLLNIRSLTIDNIHVNSSIGIGLMALNVLGGSAVQNSVFDGNASVDKQLPIRGGGNVVFVFTDTVNGSECDPHKVPQDTLNVSGCTFSHGANGIRINDYIWWLQHLYVRVPHNVTAGAGLNVILAQTNYDLSVRLNEIDSFENFALWGANMFIVLYEVVTNSSILIENSTLSNGNPLHLEHLWGTTGGGLLYVYGVIVPGNFSDGCDRKNNKLNITLEMNRVEFTNNKAAYGGALSIWETNDGEMECCHEITIHECTFFNNSGETSAAIYIFEETGLGRKGAPYIVTLNRSSFFNNSKTILYEDPNQITNPGSVVTLAGVKWTHFIDCNFTDNQVVGIESILSVIHFSGTNEFSRNSGKFGGAMALYVDSLLVLYYRTQLILTSNRAEHRGGGIFVSSVSDRFVRSPCFYQVVPNAANKTGGLDKIETKIYMKNNTAGIAGGTIYGGNLQDCIQFITGYNPNNTFHHVFDTDVNFTNTTQSAITSSTLGPCLCTPDGKPDCALPDPLNITVFPGEKFNISTIGVGQFNGIVPSVIEVETYLDGHRIGNQDSSRRSAQTTKVHRTCKNITYAVHAGKHNIVKIVLRPHKVINYRYFTKTIQVNIQKCPLGFEIKDSPLPTCKCERKLHHHCNEEDGTVRRSGSVWLGHFSGSSLYHKDCPFDYCIPDEISFILNESERQCAFNRIGVLCGACKEGLSLTLGASHCQECSNGYIALVVAFASAGLLLVLLLFVCNITVTTGTISGLIFYANVIRVNHAMFFPAGKSTTIAMLTAPLSVFIAWVNLDLGIETCFFDHMDGYAKTWLQFAFPAYIWAIAFAIIIATKYSSFLQKVWGANVVPVLATLYLLSYAKLQRTIITALSCTLLDYDWGKSTVWLYDGNVACFKGKHLVLALVAIGVVVLFILPVMLLLLFARKLQARSTHPTLKWMNKLKPFLDAYQGPYKDKYRHWTGFMLLVQNLLFLAFALNMEGSPEVNCFVTSITVFLLLWLWGKSKGIYRSSIKNALECFYLMNLGVLAVSSLYIRSQERYTPEKQHWISGVLVGVAFIVFKLILGFHVIQRARKIPAVERAFENAGGKCYEFQVFLHQRFTRSSTQEDMTVVVNEEEVATVPRQSFELVITPHSDSSISFSAELREPLLDPDTRANQMSTTST